MKKEIFAILYLHLKKFVNSMGDIMKPFKLIVTVLLPAILISGCLQVETTVKVNKDGSGTINEKVLMNRAFIDMISQFAQSFNDSSETEEFSLFKEDELKESAKDYGEGVKYLSGEKISSDDWEGYKVVYFFNDLNKIKLEPDPDKKVEIGIDSQEKKEEEYFFFKFVKGDVPQVIIDRPEIDSDFSMGEDESEETDDEMSGEFLKMMEGMKIKVAMQFNGKIVETNASYVNGSSITLLEMNLGEMMKNKEEFKKFKKSEPENIDELKEFLDEFPGMKIEFQKPVTVKFK